MDRRLTDENLLFETWSLLIKIMQSIAGKKFRLLLQHLRLSNHWIVFPVSKNSKALVFRYNSTEYGTQQKPKHSIQIRSSQILEISFRIFWNEATQNGKLWLVASQKGIHFRKCHVGYLSWLPFKGSSDIEKKSVKASSGPIFFRTCYQLDLSNNRTHVVVSLKCFYP